MCPARIWIGQCEAARGIEFEFGVPPALDYLIGEMFVHFVEAAETDSDFQEELPAFVAEIKKIFERWQLAEYFEKATLAKLPDLNSSLDDDDEDTAEIELLQHADNLVFVHRARELLIDE